MEGRSGLSRLRRRIRRELTPFRIALAYAAFGLSLLVFSDLVLPAVIRREALLHRIQALKGAVEILASAGVIYVLVSLSESRLQRYREILNSTQVGVFRATTEGEITAANEAFEALVGAERGSGVIGDDVRDFLDDETSITSLSKELKHADGVQDEEVQFRTREGRSRWASVRLRLVEDRSGRRIEGLIRDVSGRRARDQQLAVLSRVLRHNVRNKMTVITGHAEEIRERVPAARESADSLLRAADDLLSLSERQRSIADLVTDPPTAQSVDLNWIAEVVVAEERERHPEATIELHQDSTDATVTALPTVREAVAELVTNAVVHSDRESPSVTVAVDASAEAVELRVADDGPGVPDNERAVLRGEADIDQLVHGRGLGLWFVNWVVEESGGYLAFDGERSRGTTVRLQFPHGTGVP